MFNTFQAACSAITNSCSTTTTYTTRVTNTPVIGNALYIDAQATVLAGTGFIVKGNSVYTITDGIITAVTTCTTPSPISPPSNLIEQKNVYIGNSNLYTSVNVYDSVLNKFPSNTNTLTSVFTTNNFSVNSSVYKDSGGINLFGTGLIVQLTTTGFLIINLTNGIVTSTSTSLSPVALSIPTSTKILAPFKHYNNGTERGTGYAEYDANGNYLFFQSKLQIGSDGLTVTETALNNYYWKFNKEQISNQPLVNFKIPEKYKGTVVEFILVKNDLSNSFYYTILVGK